MGRVAIWSRGRSLHEAMGMRMRIGPPRFGHDAEAVRGVTLDRRVLRRAWGFARPYRGWLIAYLATIVVSSLLGLLPPLLFRWIIDGAIPSGDRRLAVWLTAVTVAAALAAAFIGVVQRWGASSIGEGMIHDLRVALFDKVQRMPVAFFTRTQTGALISRLNNDVIGAQDAVTGTLGSLVSNVIVLTTTLTTMLILEWRLTVLALVVLPLFILPAKRVGRVLQAISRERMDLNAQMNAQMTERFNVSGAMLVKLYGRYGDELSAFSGRAARVRDTGIRQALYGRVFFVALGVVSAVGVAAVYGVGAQMVISGTISLGTLVAMAAYVTRIYQPLNDLTNARVDLMTAIVSFDRVFEVLDAPVAIADRPGAVDLVDPVGRIELDHVTFRYPPATDVSVASLESPGGLFELVDEDAPEVLRDVHLTIEPGQVVALVGPSGAGKTTIASLVPRLYDVTGGAVRVDGIDVRDLTQSSLHQTIGVVAQDPHLFHESVAANLRYARPSATRADMEVACRAARIHDVVAALPDGYDTIVGERGYRLSGGEKQRLAIARMLLKDPAVVILDEATSHLDTENEVLVQAALEEALQGRTSVVIAHRLSTIRDADLICVVDAGRIVERGTHDELLALGGLYADLYLTLIGETLVQSWDPMAGDAVSAHDVSSASPRTLT
jgi:ATP-binding cassette subfamily B protein